MDNLDLISMLNHLSQSLLSVQALIAGMGYVLGLVFILSALSKLKTIMDSSQASQISMNIPIAYFLSGMALLYMPSMIETLSSTLFGQESLLRYTDYRPYSLDRSMHVIIETMGVIWFVRGCVLLAHSSDPRSGRRGSKGIGAKGLAFVVASIFAMNFDKTVSVLNDVMNGLIVFIS